jgi:hypothetical protein
VTSSPSSANARVRTSSRAWSSRLGSVTAAIVRA